jgi:putative Mn2+ efflux pump MntP
MSFGIYAIGFVIMLVGVVYGAYLMHIPTHWIAVGAIVLLGVGILSGVKATRQRDSSDSRTHLQVKQRHHLSSGSHLNFFPCSAAFLRRA